VVPTKVADAPINDPDTRHDNGHGIPRDAVERRTIAQLQVKIAVLSAKRARATGQRTETSKARNRKLW